LLKVIGEMHPCHEIHEKQNKEFDKLAGDPHPDAFVSGYPAFALSLLERLKACHCG
jgi:hypothetical protein